MTVGILRAAIEKVEELAKRTKTRSMCHSSIPGWRHRAYGRVCYLHKNINALDEDCLERAIKACERFIITFNNSVGGYYGLWEQMKLEFQERLEQLREEDDGPWEAVRTIKSENEIVNIPPHSRCIPVNCKFCTHHGLLLDDDRDNVYTSAYLCENPNAERFGLLMSGAMLCRSSQEPD